MSPSETVGEGDLPLLISSLDGDRNSPALCAPGLCLLRAGYEPSPWTKNAVYPLGQIVFSCWVGRQKLPQVIGVMHEPF